MKKIWADKELGITPDDKFAKPSNWTGDCADLQDLEDMETMEDYKP